MSSYDLAVIGSGPGGYVAAIRAAQLGLQVAVIEEEDRLGGVCLNWGCIPTKAILKAAEQFAAVRKGVPGLVVEGLTPDYGAVIDASRKAADRLSKGVAGLMKKNRIEVVKGRGRLVGKGQVGVTSGDGESVVEAPNVILASGSTEFILPGLDVDGERVLTSREALASKRLPASLVVIGGGAVGLEFAYSYAAYGVDVTVVELEDQLLPGFDAEAAQVLASSFARRKVKILTRTAYKAVEHSGAGVAVTVEGEKGEEILLADQILFGIGRRARVENLGLEELGVDLEKGFIAVGEDYRTSAEGVWAIGDVIGPPLLAHAASEEGVAAVEFMAGERKRGIDYGRVPACVYCQPQVATVGLTEDQARERGRDVAVGKIPFVASGKAVGTGHTEGFVKLVADARYGEILGCQIIGADATELIAEVTLAMELESTVRELGHTTHAHPTLSEIVKEAALACEGRALNF
ncbi:MAG: dihydrolipoyl dehydrogenase [Deltaproteobacteria bacterium]|nr:dihydrolipoyl dehydrogenase [Deltaproteobacteria bacterium]MBW2415404.1 dihydrolipoyl dehydrogenase [Deltaproteobacteria bacterium]